MHPDLDWGEGGLVEWNPAARKPPKATQGHTQSGTSSAPGISLDGLDRGWIGRLN